MDLIKKFKLCFRGGKTLAIDSMCFIYHFEDNPQYAPHTEFIFNYLGKIGNSGYTSSLTLAEILSSAKVQNDQLLATKHRLALIETPNLIIKDISLIICEKAAFLRYKYNLKLPDAIQLSTAIMGGAEIFITNDEKFRKVKEVKIVILKDFIQS